MPPQQQARLVREVMLKIRYRRVGIPPLTVLEVSLVHDPGLVYFGQVRSSQSALIAVPVRRNFE
jgi:hypothetical protein